MSSFLDRLRGKRKTSSAERQLAETSRRALLAVLDRDYDTAEALIGETVKADSEDTLPYRSLARLYLLRGEVGRAIRIHQNLLLRRDLDAHERNQVLAELAGDFRAGGFTPRAIASYQEVLAHDPKQRDALEALSELQAESGDFPAAIESAARLSRVDKHGDLSREARLWVSHALAEHADGHSDVARKAVKKALRRQPENVDARILLGELEAERGKNKAALAAWRVVPEQGGARASEAHPKVASAFAALGRARDYEAFVRQLLEKRPEDVAARMALSSALAARGETDPAILELRRVIDLQPRNREARLALGRLLLDAGRDADALKEYRELIEFLSPASLDSPSSAAPPDEGAD